MSADVPSGPFCTFLGCVDTADVVIELPDGRERPACENHTDAGEVVDDV